MIIKQRVAYLEAIKRLETYRFVTLLQANWLFDLDKLLGLALLLDAG